MKYRNALLILLLVILVDQVTKFYVKTHFGLGPGGEVFVMGDWFRLHFLENEGMAFGLKFSQTDWGKLLLTSFRLVAVVFGFFLLKRLSKQGYSRGLMVCGALILAGALGNLIDSMFYGLIFTDSPYCYLATTLCEKAKLVPMGQGYGRFLHGKVVDMFYFPIAEIPLPGGRSFTFFDPVFNVADAAITTGVLVLLVFQKKLLLRSIPQPIVNDVPTADLRVTDPKEALGHQIGESEEPQN